MNHHNNTTFRSWVTSYGAYGAESEIDWETISVGSN